MPATETVSSLSPTVTQATLLTALKNAFASAGYSSPYAESTFGTDKILVYQIISDNTKTYGTAYLRLKITTALSVTQQLFTSWNIAGVSGTNGGLESMATTFTANLPVEIRSYVKPTEFRLITMSQGSAYAMFGYLRPETRHPTFDEDFCPYIFQSANMWTSSQFVNWYSTGLSIYTTGSFTMFTSNMGNLNLGTANPQNNKRDVIAGLQLFCNSGQGITAKSSDDIITVAGVGSSRYDLLQVTPGIEEYILLFPGAGTMGIRLI